MVRESYSKPAESSITDTTCLFNVQCSITLVSAHTSHKRFSYSGFSTKILYASLMSSIHGTQLTRLILLDVSALTKLGEEC